MNDRPECVGLPGRLKDLCNGTALDHAGQPMAAWIIDAWRVQQGFEPLQAMFNDSRQGIPSDRPKANFAYFTGTNRAGPDNQIIATMLRSMRAVGVQEDLHVFSPSPVEGAIHHKIKKGYPWRHHMAKLEFLAELAGSSYEYCVWLDSDNYFTRDPGDLKPLIRENPLWVQMESDATSPKVRQKDWYSLTYPQLVALFRSEGVKTPAVWNSNGGFWIVRTADIIRVVSKAFELYGRWHAIGWKNAPDEMVLACLGAMWVEDPYLNTNERTCDTWACDWIGRYRDRLPDGRPWLYEDWLSGSTRTINPAIVHAMRSKGAMAGGRDIIRPIPQFAAAKEPVGTRLKEVIEECGVQQPPGCSCNSWIIRMNQWGVEGCRANRPAILTHLAESSQKAGWLNMIKVAARGYLSTAALLDEAIRRAS